MSCTRTTYARGSRSRSIHRMMFAPACATTCARGPARHRFPRPASRGRTCSNAPAEPACRSRRVRSSHLFDPFRESVVLVGEEVRQRVVYFRGALMRMHRAEVRQLVAVAVLDQFPLSQRQLPLLLGDYSFSIGAAHGLTLCRGHGGTHRSRTPHGQPVRVVRGYGCRSTGGRGGCVKSKSCVRSPRMATFSRTVGRGSGRPSVRGSRRCPPRKSSSMNLR